MSTLCFRTGCKIWNGDLCLQTHITVFSNKPFVHIQLYLRHITWKLQVICGHSAYWMTAILLDTFSVWFRFAWEIGLESYCPRNRLFVLWYNIVCIYCKHVLCFLYYMLVSNKCFMKAHCIWNKCRIANKCRGALGPKFLEAECWSCTLIKLICKKRM